MPQNPFEQSATPYRLWRLFRDGLLPPEAWEASSRLAGFVPSKRDWLVFADRLLLILGTVFLIAGIFFFVAFNWAELDRFGRFAIMESTVILAVVMAFVFKLDSWSGRMSLFAATMLVGASFAVVGQAYQTGADSYQLFLIWTLVISAWVLISRWNLLWFVWMVLVNISLATYWGQIIGGDYATFNLLIIVVNFGFVVLWDTLALRGLFEFMVKGRWFLYLLMLPALFYASSLMLDYIFSWNFDFTKLGEYSPLIYSGLMLALLAFYTQVRRDLLMLTMAALSVLVVSVAGSGRFVYETLFQDTTDPFFYFFIMGVITIGLTVALFMGLRYLQDRWEAS